MINFRSLGMMAFFCLVIVFCLAGNGYAQQVSPSSQVVDKDQRTPAPHGIVPAPQNPRERTAIYVFLAWIWLVILILSYFLRQKIKELDRLHHIGFFSDTRDT